MPFFCTICGEESTQICARCTKDTCRNHLCEKCLRCSDCCECEVSLEEPVREPARAIFRAVHPQPNSEPEPPESIGAEPLSTDEPKPGPVAP